ncbi:MAG: hypothetical protein IT458_14980 [Planctomycetes bacterium]|nr:hypothetical protein [Planctomycetota bacterium]
MKSHLLRLLTALLTTGLGAAPLAAQGTPFKDQIDGLIHVLRREQAKTGAYGDGTVASTAKVLAAMGHSHRFYGAHDGPVTRPALNFLFQNRQGDGSFGTGKDALAATRWAAEALSVMDAEGYRADVTAAKAWLERQGEKGELPFTAAVAEVRASLGDAGRRPEAEARAKGLAQSVRDGRVLDAEGRPMGSAAAVDALVALVAWQAALRGAPNAPRDVVANERKKPQATWGEVQERAFRFLLGQQKDGVFFVKTPQGEFRDLGLTAMGLAALQTKPKDLRTKDEQAWIEKGLAWLLASQTDLGSFGDENINYVTCAGIQALAMARDEKFQPALQKAQRLILSLQNVEERGYARGDRDYGSIGYGGDERGDLSNLQFALEAMRSTGLDPQHEAFQKALVFLTRTQNLREVNDFKARSRNEDDGTWMETAPGDDGGSAYYPGNSPMGYEVLPDGTRIPRSYGSMTYALLKCYTLAGVPASDVRVQAAVRWIGRNWNLDENPGADPKLPTKTRHQGLYYMYMVMAQALGITGIERLQVERGGKTESIDWRAELRAKAAQVQRPDGSFVNDKNDRWWEGIPVIPTTYMLLALAQ